MCEAVVFVHIGSDIYGITPATGILDIETKVNLCIFVVCWSFLFQITPDYHSKMHFWAASTNCRPTYGDIFRIST